MTDVKLGFCCNAYVGLIPRMDDRSLPITAINDESFRESHLPVPERSIAYPCWLAGMFANVVRGNSLVL